MPTPPLTRVLGDAALGLLVGVLSLITVLPDDVDDRHQGGFRGGPVFLLAGYVEASGIAGIRERAQAVDGSAEVGPLPGGGFRVRAELPADSGGLRP